MDDHTEKLNAKNDSGQKMADHCDGPENKHIEGPDTSRRKFTRNVLVGSAVLLTLSNHGAWGASSRTLKCISTNLLVSYGTGQPSALPGSQQAEIDDFTAIRDNFDGNDNVDRSISYRTGDVVEIESDTCFEYKPKE